MPRTVTRLVTPLARSEVAMADAAQKGLGRRHGAGSEAQMGTTISRGEGAVHRADFNVGSVGTRRGRRGHRGMGQ